MAVGVSHDDLLVRLVARRRRRSDRRTGCALDEGRLPDVTRIPLGGVRGDPDGPEAARVGRPWGRVRVVAPAEEAEAQEAGARVASRHGHHGRFRRPPGRRRGDHRSARPRLLQGDVLDDEAGRAADVATGRRVPGSRRGRGPGSDRGSGRVRRHVRVAVPAGPGSGAVPRLRRLRHRVGTDRGGGRRRGSRRRCRRVVGPGRREPSVLDLGGSAARGTGGRLRARGRSPRRSSPAERPATCRPGDDPDLSGQLPRMCGVRTGYDSRVADFDAMEA